jgi:3-hydroxyisobutyrate dehydrogenase-like beta-hydroxyacid dehydrogenase
MMNITLLHPGQMGAAVGAQAVAGGATVRWCSTGRSDATAGRAAEAGLQGVNDLEDLLARSDVVISLCPPAFAEDVARQVAAHAHAHDHPYVFVEANAISPRRCVRIAALFPPDRFIDATVIGPPPRAGATARLHVAGPRPLQDRLHDIFAGTSLQVISLSDQAADASALKMAFASYQKATSALAGVSLALATHHHVEAALLAEAQRFARSPLADPGYLPSVAARAWRWAPEMLEVADALDDAGLPTDLARGASAVLHRWDAAKDAWQIDVAAALDHLHER